MPVIRPEYPLEICLDAIRVPDENQLTEVGRGLALARESLIESRVLYSANSRGTFIRRPGESDEDEESNLEG